jgi:hypothetical protein
MNASIISQPEVLRRVAAPAFTPTDLHGDAAALLRQADAAPAACRWIVQAIGASSKPAVLGFEQYRTGGLTAGTEQNNRDRKNESAQDGRRFHQK